MEDFQYSGPQKMDVEWEWRGIMHIAMLGSLCMYSHAIVQQSRLIGNKTEK